MARRDLQCELRLQKPTNFRTHGAAETVISPSTGHARDEEQQVSDVGSCRQIREMKTTELIKSYGNDRMDEEPRKQPNI